MEKNKLWGWLILAFGLILVIGLLYTSFTINQTPSCYLKTPSGNSQSQLSQPVYINSSQCDVTQPYFFKVDSTPLIKILFNPFYVLLSILLIILGGYLLSRK